jgi:nicotinamide phosphoribosyltransferase
MLPDNMTGDFDYWEARTGARFPFMTFFGLQAIIKEYLIGKVVTKEKIDAAERLNDVHLGPGIFQRQLWEYILEKYNGMLPVTIKAVPEGMTIPVSNAMITIETEDPAVAWLPGHLETLISQVWYPSTVCTLSREVKKMIAKYLDETADNRDGLPFKLHDFGYRGVSSVESAGLGGMAHLVNFLGTDTLRALEYAMHYYDANLKTLGFSIPATEHRIMTVKGREGEAEQYERVLDKFPKGYVAIVSDSYNIYNAADQILGVKLHDKVMKRDGTVVVRPDSGDNPAEIMLKLHTILGDRFGYSYNRRGYKVLDPHVRLIWGDGIDYDGIDNILGEMKVHKWSADNPAFGMGGGLLQKVNRDTQRCALKCSASRLGDIWRDVYKDPICGSKKSKRGRLALVYDKDSGYRTVPVEEAGGANILKPVFKTGVLTRDYTFDEVRENAAIES